MASHGHEPWNHEKRIEKEDVFLVKVVLMRLLKEEVLVFLIICLMKAACCVPVSLW